MLSDGCYPHFLCYTCQTLQLSVTAAKDLQCQISPFFILVTLQRSEEALLGLFCYEILFHSAFAREHFYII